MSLLVLNDVMFRSVSTFTRGSSGTSRGCAASYRHLQTILECILAWLVAVPVLYHPQQVKANQSIKYL